MESSPRLHRVPTTESVATGDSKSHDQSKNNDYPSTGGDEFTLKMHEYPAGPQWKTHSIIIAIILSASLMVFCYAVIKHEIIDHEIESVQYTVIESIVNVFMIIFSIYIYVFYIYIYKSPGHGRVEGRDCTNFDVYAIFSLLWFFMTVLSYLTYGDALYGIFTFSRMIAMIMPGFIHQTYIRLVIKDEYRCGHYIYLGDIMIYKQCCIIFLALQLLSNVVSLPSNVSFFQDSISDIFHLDDKSDIFHFPFIIASVFGRPFVSILNFHLLILYLTWFVNGDKPQTHHNLDRFALTMHDEGLNVLFGVIVMVLYIIDVIFSQYIWYRSLVLFTYFVSSVYHVYFLVTEGRKTHQRMSIVENKKKQQEEHARVDVFTIFESSFVLFGGVLASSLYIANIHDFVDKFDAVSELAAWSLFMMSQYIFIIFIQLDYVHGRKLLMRPRTQQMLSYSALISAVSITFLFSFEYAHFVEFLTHHDAHHQPVTMTISYSLFWCLLEYFIWSFVAINHMLHHVEHVAQLEHIHEIERNRVSMIMDEMKQQKKKKRMQMKLDLKLNSSKILIAPPSPLLSATDITSRVMNSKQYQATMLELPFAPQMTRLRSSTFLFITNPKHAHHHTGITHLDHDVEQNIYE